MCTESNSHDFEKEYDELRALKKDDSYTFTYQFEYIAKNHGNDNYDIDTADMVVSVEWNDPDAGYEVSYVVPDMHKIDPTQGNSGAEGFWDYGVESRFRFDMGLRGIGSNLII